MYGEHNSFSHNGLLLKLKQGEERGKKETPVFNRSLFTESMFGPEQQPMEHLSIVCQSKVMTDLQNIYLHEL